MSSPSEFESRTGRIGFSGEKVYNFVTDLRNFERFIPGGTVNDLKIGCDSGSFKAGMLGSVNIRVTERTPHSKVVFSGNALGENNYSLILNIDDTKSNKSEVKLRVIAEMNPMLKMVASDPVRRFLEMMITEMEKFREWEKTIKDNQPL
jgi:carbon monoxide dehydrogenase subunit G